MRWKENDRKALGCGLPPALVAHFSGLQWVGPAGHFPPRHMIHRNKRWLKMRWVTWRAVCGGPCEREGKGEGFDFAAVKPTTPFGQLPLLYVDGDEAGFSLITHIVP